MYCRLRWKVALWVLACGPALWALHVYPVPASSPSGSFEVLDQTIEHFMKERRIPGGALAVVKDRRLVYSRAYGWADREDRVAATSTSLFRIASVSKCITAVAILKLVEEGKLRLDARAFDLLIYDPARPAPAQPDSRLKAITIQHLLNHAGGWDRQKSFDPMFRSRAIEKAEGVPPPPRPDAIIHYMLGQKLDYNPGTRYAYSNFGYCVLGRVIESVTGLRYEDYVQRHILSPIGITDMRIGHSLRRGRAENEVCYYTPNGRTGSSVFSIGSEIVPSPYGTFCLESMDSHGGWIASAVDLVRFAAALDNPTSSPLLKSETFDIMYRRPNPPLGRKKDGSPADTYYACGWLVRPLGGYRKANYWHTGSIPGTFSVLVRRADGISWAAVFNQRSTNTALPDTAIDPLMNAAIHKITRWPAANLFTSTK